jgi:pimeloyl-ACP methyl ester carboxylesterase
MIHGELDPLLKMEYLEKNKDYGGYDIEVIEDCGHYISLEKSDQFNRIIIQFSSNIFN